ncbi:alpha-ketoacid dehydrogenase kinase [Linnemannia elongata AG-77]|uniref:Protein-serine/threonine kinase n=1 Tax=Linnemannia elongata AG-77 TaxID=1314771 RepID=A0A197K1N1_9FUNG|nr:alpha-ketoacid dehydrogenase kinase [Linnemannia elongata AG-77]
MARYARKELPVRLARRVKSIQNLPFIIGTNPYIKRVYRLYYDSFQALTAFREDIRDKEDLDQFAEVLRGLVESHADVIPMLSQGFLECKKYMNTADIQTFLDEMIRSRIGIRLIAEQVIALRAQRTDLLKDDQEEESAQDNGTTTTTDQSNADSKVIGVVHTQLKPAELVKDCASFVQELCNVNYGSSPDVVINGQTDATFTYVPVHLEYILCELLKNSLRATVEHSVKIGRSFGHPPVEVTIAQSEHEITIRIRDQGGGVSQEDLDHIFDYSFTTVKDDNETSSSFSSAAPDGSFIFTGVSRLAMQAGLGGPIAGLGFGLPLTRIYAQYFGGRMHLVSMQGHGVDVYLKLKQLQHVEDLQI